MTENLSKVPNRHLFMELQNLGENGVAPAILRGINVAWNFMLWPNHRSREKCEKDSQPLPPKGRGK